MREVIASEFVSLDGVFEAPDQWHFPYFDEEMGEEIGRAMAASDAMLMGRVLYEEWADFWPRQDPVENPVAGRMNGGKRLFEEGGDQIALELVDSRTFSTGVAYLTYRPAKKKAEG